MLHFCDSEDGLATRKLLEEKISTFSKLFAKQFTSNTTFLFRDFDYFFLGQFTTRTNFQRCKFYWNSLAEMPPNHNKKDAFFRNLPVKRSQKTVKNTKTPNLANLTNVEIWKPGLRIPCDHVLFQLSQKNRKTLFCVSRLVNAQNTNKYRKIIQKNSD